MVLVKWKSKTQGNFITSWFELQDVAITIQNEAFGIIVNPDYDDTLHQVPSLEDVLEERPRHTANEAYQPPSLQEKPIQFPSLDTAHSDYRTKPLRTSSSMKHMYASKQQTADTTPDRRSASLQTSPIDMTGQFALLRGKLDHSSRPAVWSYCSRTTGIPPHPMSKFFHNISHSMRLPSPSYLTAPPVAYVEHSPTATLAGPRPVGGMRRTYSAMLPPSMHRSPTVVSDIQSESAAFAKHSMIRSSSFGPVIHQNRLLHRFPNHPLPEPPAANNPYEVPITRSPLAQLPEGQAAVIYSEVDMPENEAGTTHGIIHNSISMHPKI